MHREVLSSPKSRSRQCLTECTFCRDSHVPLFLEKHRAAVVSAVSTRIVHIAQGSAWALTAQSITSPPMLVDEQNLGPTFPIPFPVLFLVAAKGRCFQIPLPQNKAGVFLLLNGTQGTSQLPSFINMTETSQTPTITSHLQAKPPKKCSN